MMSDTAKNITPPELKVEERTALIKICDNSLSQFIRLLNVQYIVAIGNFAKLRAEKVIKEYNFLHVNVLVMMHPSPINPAANKGWKNIAYKQLEEGDVLKYLL